MYPWGSQENEAEEAGENYNLQAATLLLAYPGTIYIKVRDPIATTSTVAKPRQVRLPLDE